MMECWNIGEMGDWAVGVMGGGSEGGAYCKGPLLKYIPGPYSNGIFYQLIENENPDGWK
jgi:hypothetical protein